MGGRVTLGVEEETQPELGVSPSAPPLLVASRGQKEHLDSSRPPGQACPSPGQQPTTNPQEQQQQQQREGGQAGSEEGVASAAD